MQRAFELVSPECATAQTNRQQWKIRDSAIQTRPTDIYKAALNIDTTRLKVRMLQLDALFAVNRRLTRGFVAHPVGALQK
jgi:hypothetical protein